MPDKNHASLLRVLSAAEIELVAGADGDSLDGGEIVVTGARVQSGNNVNLYGGSGNWYLNFNPASYGSGQSFFQNFFNDDGVITQDVPAPTNEAGDIIIEATPEQVAAAKQAYAQAGFELSTLKVLAVIGSALASRYLGAAVAGANEVVDINRDSLQNSYADLLYYEDGLDGTYDGYVGTPPHTPEMPY